MSQSLAMDPEKFFGCIESSPTFFGGGGEVQKVGEDGSESIKGIDAKDLAIRLQVKNG
jgi:hypothetical protein